jgi:hypothetical protein
MRLQSDVQIPVADVLAHIAAQRWVWVRLAAVKDKDQWHQAILELTTGEAPPSWRKHELIYQSAIFIATRRKGSIVASWLSKGRVQLSGCPVRLSALSGGTVQSTRLDSHATSQFETLPWPSVEMTLAPSPVNQYQPQEILAADGYPTFFNFYAAAAWFFWLDRSPVGGSVNRGTTYRHQDTSARITRVVFGKQRVQVEVDGDSLVGTTVEVAGEVPGPSRRLTRRSRPTVRFQLPDGLPSGAFVIIRRGGQWLDRRFLKWPYARGDHPDVEEELVQIEPTSMLDFFVESREGQQVEFKAGLPGETDDQKKTVMKTVAAFANGEGGSLLFGITKEYEVIGVPGANIANEEDRISDLIDDWVSPRPTWRLEVYPVANKAGFVVLALHVTQGTEPPYATGTKNVPIQYYVRHASRSVPARPNELRSLARSRPPESPPAHPFGLA